MSITNIAIFGILLGFAFLVAGYLMGGPETQTETPWNKAKPVNRRAKKRVAVSRPQRKAA